MIAWWRRRKRWNEAAMWYARMAEPRSPDELAAFERWLARAPANAQAYAEMDAIAGAAAVAGRQDGARSPGSRGSNPRSRLARPAFALALAAAAVASAVILAQGAPTRAFAAVVNDGNAVRGVRLTDGTALWLDVGARVGVRFDGKRREIAVRSGRVRISPADEARPLRVTAAGLRIPAGEGTFDVAVLHDGVTVSALDGSLTAVPAASGADDSGIRLRGGEAVKIDAGGIHPAAVDRSWPAGRLRFDRARLGRIVELANRQDGPDLSVDRKETADLRVSGVFDLRDTRRLARKLAATLELKVDETPGGLLLRR